MNGFELIEILKKNPEDTVYFATENHPASSLKFEIPPKKAKSPRLS